MDMQTVDGDEFIQEQERIILLYCNKGERQQSSYHKDDKHKRTYRHSQGTHYHVQEKKKDGEAKKTDAHPENPDRPRNTYRHSQGTQENGQEPNNYCETKKTDAHSEKPDKPRKGDHKAQEEQVDNIKAKHGIIYKDEKKEEPVSR
eukprot:15536093-Heterocapsa_arctica.AAC.1